MKKFFAILLTLMLAVFVTVSVAACGDTESEEQTPSNGEQTPGGGEQTSGGGGQQAPAEQSKLNYDMSGVSWDYTAPFTYDDTEKTVTVSGLPDGVTVKAYSGNSATDAGSYTASVKFNYDETEYNEPTLPDCSFAINKAVYAGLELNGARVEYDATPHAIYITGNVPANTVVSYTYNDEKADEVTEVGSYTVVCTLKNKNYVDKQLTATLEITATEERLYSTRLGANIYFQNNLDDNKLYSVTSSGSILVKVNNDIPEYMVANGSKLYYYSKSMFSKMIKSYDGSTVANVLSSKGEYLTTDGNYIYFAVNNAIVGTDQNGIYKYQLNGEATEAVRLTSDKAAYLTYYNNKIYYSNLSEGKKLYSVSATAANVKGTQLHDEQVSDIIEDGGSLYFNSTKTVLGVGAASAVKRYIVSSGSVVKLTTDSGKYLTKIGNDIFYVNNDRITSTVFGDGIYKVNALATADSEAKGTKVLSSEDGNGYSSLASDGMYLYYYKLNDKHFYRNTASGNNESDLMRNFIPPAESVTLSGFANTAAYNGEIYYTNPLDGSALYKYNPTTKAKFKVLAESVSGAYFNGDYMYYNSYILTNYEFFRLNLKTGETQKINGDRCENLVFEGNKIYYVKRGVGSNLPYVMNLDGTEDTLLCDAKISSGLTAPKININTGGFYKSGNTLIFNHNPAVGYQYLIKCNIETKAVTNSEIKSSDSRVLGNRIYFYDHVDKNLKSCAMDFSDVKQIKSQVEITDMFVLNNTLYFSSCSSQNTGLFKVDTASDSVSKISDNQANGFSESGGKLYFLQASVTYTDHRPIHAAGSDGRLYCYDGSKVTKVA